MPNQDKRTRFEQDLARLKQARDSREITIDTYIEQAGNLHFDDTAAGKTWWLDPESEIWYVAAIGSEDFEPSEPIQETKKLQSYRYRIEEQIGQGTNFDLYRALDPQFGGRPVALKVLKAGWLDNQEAVAHFEREATVMARLHHPHIVSIYRFGENQGQLYIAQQWIEGESLAQRLSRGALSWRETLDILRPIAAALDYVHGLGVIHRDVKPSNILLDQNGKPYLSDFGLVWTRTGLSGTPVYMTPEQWMGNAAGPATDVYALACVAVEMLSGQPPFDAPTREQLFYKHVNDPPTFPGQWPEGVPAEVTPVLGRALAKNPADRFGSAGEFVAALERAENKRPLVGQPPITGCPIMLIAGWTILIALSIFLGLTIFTPAGLGPTPTLAIAGTTRTPSPRPPTDTPTVLPSPVAIDEKPKLGEMAVERPMVMAQGESASWVVEMSIPAQYASIEIPTGIEFVKVSSAALPEEGALYSTDLVPLWLSRYMEIELRAPAGFTLDGPPAVWKEIKLDDPRPYMVWEWLLTAPDKPGTHEILLNVYQAKVAPTNATSGTEVDTRERAIPPRRYQIKVVAYTPTPVPPSATPTPTPTITPTPTPVPFFDRPGTTTSIGAFATIIAALIGVVGVLAARDRIPLLTKGQKRQSLQKQIAEKTRRLNLLKEQQARHGINTDPAVLTEIEDLGSEIEQLEQELKALG